MILKVPDYLGASWLTGEYVSTYGWWPVPDEYFQQHPEYEWFQDTPFGVLPWKGRDELKPGDIIIFNEYDEWTDERDVYKTDRFLPVDEQDIEEYRRGEHDMLPVGVVVHPPSYENHINQDLWDFFRRLRSSEILISRN